MQRTLRGFVMTLAVLVLAIGVADAKKKRKKKKPKVLAPVSVTFTNNCKADLSFKLDTLQVKVAAGATVAAQEIKSREDYSFPLILDSKTGDLGLIGLFPGQKYLISFSKCASGAANLTTENLSEVRPEGLSPQAAPKVRFRAKRLANGRLPAMEYRAGKKGFKWLSIGFTSYEELVPGEFKYTFRYRGMKKRGPVRGMVNGSVTLKAGHRYLIEGGVAGSRHIFVKFEDEGWIDQKKK